MPYADPVKRKEYHKKYWDEWRRKNPDKIKACQKRYRDKPEYLEKVRKRNKSVSLYEHLAKVTKPLEKWGNPRLDIKTRARRNTIRAVRRHKITKPNYCEECQRILPPRLIHAHHLDYKNWQDIRWLCRSCHEKEHHGKDNHNNKQS